jgi:hypothetical protein
MGLRCQSNTPCLERRTIMNRPGPRPTRTVIVAGAVALMLGAGTAVAAAAVMSDPSPVSSSGVIDG